MSKRKRNKHGYEEVLKYMHLIKSGRSFDYIHNEYGIMERLRYENACLKTENALLKKVKALVEEREARLKGIGRKPSKD